ncbi:MAG: hypothetical protein M0T85_11780, partial [Dehalococcoidales bacterium]|nr:hypothetical protein [Dehalococcoidales bacterium]
VGEERIGDDLGSFPLDLETRMAQVSDLRHTFLLSFSRFGVVWAVNLPIAPAAGLSKIVKLSLLVSKLPVKIIIEPTKLRYCSFLQSASRYQGSAATSKTIIYWPMLL